MAPTTRDTDGDEIAARDIEPGTLLWRYGKVFSVIVKPEGVRFVTDQGYDKTVDPDAPFRISSRSP